MEQEEDKTNGLDHNPDDTFLSASVTVNLFVADIVGKPVETDEEKELFLALISSFFSSDIIHVQLQDFVRLNMEPKSDIIIPDKTIIIP